MISTAYTDIGKKQVNQDSLLVDEADTPDGPVLLAAVCDGMGGLSRGEYASCRMVEELDAWFKGTLPDVLRSGPDMRAIRIGIENCISRVDRELEEVSELSGALGTTAACLLLYRGSYLIENVGDSRVYRVTDDGAYLLTHDQTVVQQEIDKGILTPKEAAKDPRRHILLQCIGAEGTACPAYGSGTYGPDDVFLLCSDGLRHALPDMQIGMVFSPALLRDEAAMRAASKSAVEYVKKRKEKDNISVILVRDTRAAEGETP